MLDDLSFLSRSTSDIDLHFWVTGALALISCPLQSMFTLWKSICVVLGLLGLYPACFARINTLRSSERGCSLSTHSLVIAFLFFSCSFCRSCRFTYRDLIVNTLQRRASLPLAFSSYTLISPYTSISRLPDHTSIFVTS